ncbi:MAG: hypothetical protein ACYC63_12845 [Armatimonadota bacterium]
MATTTMRLDLATQAVIRELARERKQPMNLIVKQAVDCYRRELMLDQANAVWATMRDDKAKWEEEMAEQSMLDGSLLDGLADDE